MILSFLLWMYISLVCWIWGFATVRLLNQFFPKEEPCHFHKSITCLIGLTVLTLFGSYFSLFIKLDQATVHCGVFLMSAALYIYYKPKISSNEFLKLTTPIKYLLLVCLIVIAVMSTWVIKHPDTLGYHLQIIDSIKEKGLVVGYAQQNLRFGFQSNWFISCALFGFDFFHTHAITFVNASVCIWFIYFVLTNAQNSFVASTKSYKAISILWLLLLSFSFWDYTQIRLTITSASPDFIIAVYFAAIFFIFCNFKSNSKIVFLLAGLSMFALTIKSSSFVLVIFTLLLFLKTIKGSLSNALKLLLVLSAILFPYLVRNYFTSGYIFYPLHIPDIFFASWQIEYPKVHHMQEYITAYARVRDLADILDVKEVLAFPMRKWLPIWWSYNSFAQKLIMILSLSGIIPWLIAVRKAKTIAKEQIKLTWILSALGIVGWFFLAPDLRFGTGYFIVFIAISLSALFRNYFGLIKQNTFSLLCYGITITLTVYIVYRLVYFFSLKQVLLPLGI